MAIQVNLKFPEPLYRAASKFARSNGYRNVQDVVYESVREKVNGKRRYDESFTEREIALIEKIAETSLRKGLIVGEKEIRSALRK